MVGANPGRRAKRPHPADLAAERAIATAVRFTTNRFLGRGIYDRRDFDTLGEAHADAAGDPRAMVYAITPEGFTVPVSKAKK
jgi:hypothetical protein